MKHLRSLHLIAGVAGLAAFLLSGQYMHHFLGHLRSMPDGPRLLYRTAHIYLLWASLLNMLLGAYFAPAVQSRVRILQCAASIMVLVSPVLVAFSFLTESASPELIRPACRIGIYLAFAGCMIHAFASAAARRHRPAMSADRTPPTGEQT